MTVWSLAIRQTIRRRLFFTAALGTVSAVASLLTGQDYMVEATLGERTELGIPLASDGSNYLMLRRDGSLKKLSHRETGSLKKTTKVFRPYPIETFASRLAEVYGPRYEVSRTTHFVVVHPPGKRQKWAAPVEKLHRQFVHFFSSRDLSTAAPEFPLVVIVFRTRHEFDAYTARRGLKPSAHVGGYYLQQNNRVVTYDQADGLHGRRSESVTLIHEIAHLSAFNTGIQSRYAPPPKWLAEGVAVLFEAPGIRDPFRYPRFEDRIRQAHLQRFLDACENRKGATYLETLVRDDRWFDARPDIAYAFAWATTFYLAETRPYAWMKYCRAIAKRKPFSSYSETQRMRDFADAFGTDLNELTARMRQFFRSN